MKFKSENLKQDSHEQKGGGNIIEKEKRKFILTDIDRAHQHGSPDFSTSVIVFNYNNQEIVVDGNHKLREVQKNPDYKPNIIDICSVQDIVTHLKELERNAASNSWINELVKIPSVIPNEKERPKIMRDILKERMKVFRANNPDYFKEVYKRIKAEAKMREEAYAPFWPPDDPEYSEEPKLSDYPEEIQNISEPEIVEAYRDKLLEELMVKSRKSLEAKGLDLDIGHGSIEI